MSKINLEISSEELAWLISGLNAGMIENQIPDNKKTNTFYDKLVEIYNKDRKIKKVDTSEGNRLV